MIPVDAADGRIRFLALALICNGFIPIVAVAAVALVSAVFFLPLFLGCLCLDVDEFLESATERHDVRLLTQAVTAIDNEFALAFVLRFLGMIFFAMSLSENSVAPFARRGRISLIA